MQRDHMTVTCTCLHINDGSCWLVAQFVLKQMSNSYCLHGMVEAAGIRIIRVNQGDRKLPHSKCYHYSI